MSILQGTGKPALQKQYALKTHVSMAVLYDAYVMTDSEPKLPL